MALGKMRQLWQYAIYLIENHLISWFSPFNFMALWKNAKGEVVLYNFWKMWLKSLLLCQNPLQKHLHEEMIYFSLELCCNWPPREVKAGSQSRDQEAGTEAEAMEECYLLAFCPWLAQPGIIISPRTTCPGVASLNSRLCPPTSITNQENKHLHRLAHEPQWKQFLGMNSLSRWV